MDHLPCQALLANLRHHPKNGEEDFVQVRADLVVELKAWMVERFGPVTPLPDSKLFDIGTQFCRVLDRDLKAAGIPKKNERGKQIDMHALRTTFGTMLSKHGVPPRVAQRLTRRSRIDLTMRVYTDAKLFDLHGALEALPSVAPTPVKSGATESSSGKSVPDANVA